MNCALLYVYFGVCPHSITDSVLIVLSACGLNIYRENQKQCSSLSTGQLINQVNNDITPTLTSLACVRRELRLITYIASSRLSESLCGGCHHLTSILSRKHPVATRHVMVNVPCVWTTHHLYQRHNHINDF